jgi:hypothetical protein
VWALDGGELARIWGSASTPPLERHEIGSSMTGGRTDGHQAFKEARQKGSFGCGRTPSNLWLRPALQFHEARSLCQSRHAAEAAVITIAVAKAPNNATIIAMIATKVSVIDIRFRSSIFAVLSMRANSEAIRPGIPI